MSTAAPVMSSEARSGHDRRRGVAAVVCLVLAALLTTPAGIAYWGQRTVNDTERYVATVGPLADAPEVQAAIASKATDVLQEQVDVEAILEEVFAGVITERPRLQALTGPIAGAVNGMIESQVLAFLASDAFAEFWVIANTRLQQGLIRVLEGTDDSAVSLQGEQVVLDVSEVIERVKQRLVDRGLTMIEDLPLPAADRQIVLFDAPQLAQARVAHAVVQPVAEWMIAAAALFYVAALLLSRRRPRMTVAIGLVLGVNALVLGAALTVGRSLFVEALSGTALAQASTVTYDTVMTFLLRGQDVMLSLALVLVVTGWFLGRNASGTAVRRTVRGGLQGLGAGLGSSPAAGAGRWVDRNIGWLRVAVLGVGGLVFLWGNQVSQSQLVQAVLIVLLLLAILQVLIGAAPEDRVEGSTLSR